MAEQVRVHVHLFGRVQGVGFRYWAADEARLRGLVGWVRNLDSGAVEAVFQGPREAVEDVVRWCREGPDGAYVRDARVAWDEPLEPFSRFDIRSTNAD